MTTDKTGRVSYGQFIVYFPEDHPSAHMASNIARALAMGDSVALPDSWSVQRVPHGLRTLDWWADFIHKWASRVFPNMDVETCKRKLVAEVAEFLADKNPQPGEIADILIVLLHIARLSQISPEWAVNEKMKINLARRWLKQSDGTYQHEMPADQLVDVKA